MTIDRRTVIAGLGIMGASAYPVFAADETPKPAEATTEATAESTEKPQETTVEDTPKDETATAYVTDDIVLGSDDAPVTVYEYASFTCPHCASFHNKTWPKIKEAYVDTGKVRFIMREVYFDQYGLWASMTARCGGKKGFYPMVDTFLATQSTWTRAQDIGAAIQQIGRRAGLSAERLGQCLSDRDYAKALLANYQKNAGADEVTSTPTFIIDGEKHTGDMSYEEFATLIDAALSKS